MAVGATGKAQVILTCDLSGLFGEVVGIACHELIEVFEAAPCFVWGDVPGFDWIVLGTDFVVEKYMRWSLSLFC